MIVWIELRLKISAASDRDFSDFEFCLREPPKGNNAPFWRLALVSGVSARDFFLKIPRPARKRATSVVNFARHTWNGYKHKIEYNFREYIHILLFLRFL